MEFYTYVNGGSGLNLNCFLKINPDESVEKVEDLDPTIPSFIPWSVLGDYEKDLIYLWAKKEGVI